jgi:hypothetical protein
MGDRKRKAFRGLLSLAALICVVAGLTTPVGTAESIASAATAAVPSIVAKGNKGLAAALVSDRAACARGSLIGEFAQGPQSPLHDFMVEVWAAARQMGDGWAGAVSDDANSRVVIFWKGPTPPALDALVGVTPEGVLVEVRAVPYSAKQMHAAALRIFKAARHGRIPLPSSAGSGGTGLTVAFTPELLATHGEVRLWRQVKGLVGIPVCIVSEEMPQPD